MKRIFSSKKLVLLLLLFVIPLAAASNINVKLLSLEPSIVTPGNFFSITLEATNTDNETLNDVKFELKTSSNFNVEDEEEIEFEELKAGEKTILAWLVRADKSATAGFKKLELIVDEGSKDYSYFFPFQVKSFEPTLVLESFTTAPSQVAPGSNVVVNLNLANQASFSLKNVRVKLDLSKMPFAPVGGIDEQTINELTTNKQLKFQLTASSDSEAGIFKIPVILNYFDEFGTPYTNTNLISLKIGSTPKLELSQESSLILVNQKSEATLKLVNNGLTKIKLLTVNIQPVNTELLSSNNVYIGDLNADDFNTIDLELYPKLKEAQLILTLNFKDANNNEFKETVPLPLKVYTSEEAKELGLLAESRGMSYLIGVIVLVLLFFVYKKLRK